MNNSRIEIESSSLEAKEVDRKEFLRESEQKTIHLIEAIQRVEQSEDWSTLKTEIFDGLTLKLNKQLQEEAKKEVPDTLVLNRLSGQIIWADKYSDLSKLGNTYRLELTKIRKLLYGTE